LRRHRKEQYGDVVRIPPAKGGAVAHCKFCHWSAFVEDRKRKKWNSIDRAAAKLRAHFRRKHSDKIVHFSTAAEIFGDQHGE
jgi:hypothetical protein